MSSLANLDRVRRALAECFGEFARMEVVLRAELANALAEGDSVQARNLLERRTRRFLVDKILLALGWDPANPSAIREEARASSQTGDALYFDYLGLEGASRTPVLIVEAKGADVDAPRRKNERQPLNARETAEHLASEIAIIKGGRGNSKATAEWREYLGDLRTYVESLGPAGRATLRRVVITTGKWLIVFSEPSTVFVDPGLPDAENIQFFATFEDMQAKVEVLHSLLHRQRLVDDIPLTLSVADALSWMRSSHVAGYARAALIATTTSGAARRQYPTRSIYPALAIETGERWFVVVDYDSDALEEKTQVDEIGPLLEALRARGQVLERRMSGVIGTASQPRSLALFEGLPQSPVNSTLGSRSMAAEPGSTAARSENGEAPNKRFVTSSGELGVADEYVVITGESWFYKSNIATGPACTYHSWRIARQDGVASGDAPVTYRRDCFTEDGQVRHCAHGDHRATREKRCHIDSFETHICCRACVFEQQCWGDNGSPLPCPVLSTGTITA